LKTTIKKLANGEISGKPLTEQLSGFYSVRDGNYRIIYRSFDDKIILFDMGHRSKVYRDFNKNQ